MGRPRAFCEQQALDAAMRVFWQKGYEGASLDDLTQAMKINRSSLYSTFGDKEALFRRALNHYASGPMRFLPESMDQPTARAAIQTLLRSAVKFLADSSHPGGCLTLQAGLTCGTGAESVKQAMIESRNRGLSQIESRMQQAAKEGDLPEGVDPKNLARYVASLLSGLGVQAANGASRSELMGVVDVAMDALPLKN